MAFIESPKKSPLPSLPGFLGAGAALVLVLFAAFGLSLDLSAAGFDCLGADCAYGLAGALPTEAKFL